MKILGVILGVAVCIGVGVWVKLHGYFRPGNRAQYDPKHVSPNPNSPLRGKVLFCLGSSVTAGMAARGISFLDYLQAMDGCKIIRETAPGSTLADRGPKSYLKRLMSHPAAGESIDLFLCQLSTNDATFHSQLGSVSDSWAPADFDTKTTVGGMEAIIDYAQKTWGCPIVFYTGTKYDNPRYHYLVNQLLELQEKWEITVVDLWHDDQMNQVTPQEYRLYMNDGVHPTKAGYELWWTPAIQRNLYRLFSQEKTQTDESENS